MTDLAPITTFVSSVGLPVAILVAGWLWLRPKADLLIGKHVEFVDTVSGQVKRQTELMATQNQDINTRLEKMLSLMEHR